MDSQFKYAGFWMRFGAHLIDSIILGIVNFFITLPIILSYGFFEFFERDRGRIFFTSSENLPDSDLSIDFIIALFKGILIAVIVTTVVNWLYYALFESSKKQATIGKMALNIKVTDMAGNKITFMRATGRYFGKILSGLFLMIGYIMAAFTEKKQALHDILAGCLVVKNVISLEEIQKMQDQGSYYNPMN